jgi:hypothetical protein
VAEVLAREPRAAGRPVALAAGTALALALSVAAAVRQGAVADPPEALGGRIERIAAAHDLRPVPEPAFRRVPCRPNALVGATADRMVSRAFLPPDGLARVEVAVYGLRAPRARLSVVADGLRRCGRARLDIGPEGADAVYRDVVHRGRVVTWRVDVSGPVSTVVLARLSYADGYLVYVADQRLADPGRPPPHDRTRGDAIAAEVAAAL